MLAPFAEVDAASSPPRLFYVGVLDPVTDGTCGEVVDAVVVPMLSECAPSGGGSTAIVPAQASTVLKKRAPQTYKTHYVCTSCGWNGVTRQRHKERRPDCKFIPCPMRYVVGESAPAKAKEYLARCTPAQREQGLPPDGERALQVTDDSIMVPIPVGCKPGDAFEVLIDKGAASTP